MTVLRAVGDAEADPSPHTRIISFLYATNSATRRSWLKSETSAPNISNACNFPKELYSSSPVDSSGRSLVVSDDDDDGSGGDKDDDEEEEEEEEEDADDEEEDDDPASSWTRRLSLCESFRNLSLAWRVCARICFLLSRRV